MTTSQPRYPMLTLVRIILMILGVGLAPVAARASNPDGTPTGVEDDSFQVGGSCAALAYLSAEQIRTTIKQAFSDDRHSFCFPEEPSECADYTSLLQGLGRLTTGEDGYHCNLQVQI